MLTWVTDKIALLIIFLAGVDWKALAALLLLLTVWLICYTGC